MHEPARLPPRLHHKSARILVRKRRSVKRTTLLTRSGDPVNAELAARVLDRNVREVARLEAEPWEKRRETAADRPLGAVLDLEHDAEPVARGTEKPLGAALGDPTAPEAHELGVGGAVAPDQLGASTHRVGDIKTAVEELEPREGLRHPLERQGVGRDAAPVDGGRKRSGL